MSGHEPGQLAENEVPDGTPCIDKACAATSAEGCRYPHWMMCGHRVERPQRSVGNAVVAMEDITPPEGAIWCRICGRWSLTALDHDGAAHDAYVADLPVSRPGEPS